MDLLNKALCCLCVVAHLVCTAPNTRAQIDLREDLQSIRVNRHMPGIAALAIKDGRIIAQGASGVRRVGDVPPLQITDRVNIASCTKWMTAAVAGRLVDKGAIRWDTRIRDLFTNYNSFKAAYADVTLDQLLCHQGGVEDSATFDKLHLAEFMTRTGGISRVRQWVAEIVLKDSPAAPGTYSNQGYAVVGRMLEFATGKDWETLIREEIFEPLRMTSADFGCVFDDVTPARAPVGHTLATSAITATPMPAAWTSTQFLVQAAYGPGGFVACTLQDWAKFLHMQVTSDLSDFLSPATAQRLQQSYAGVQGYGRGINAGLTRTWASPGFALSHSGDLYGHETVVWLAPARRFAVVVFTNCKSTDDSTARALDDVAALLVTRYSSAASSGPLLEEPRVLSIIAGPSLATLTFETLPGLSYYVESSSDLANWRSCTGRSPIPARDVLTRFSHANGVSPTFYRVVPIH